ncbi:MAG TPA: hypothetical protein VMR95_02525, partial [Candidatus Binatia bacterium]|nr:hypothetical protein [Candidatus Binatia bacterium]
MNYYEVLVASAYFHGHEALTYGGSEVIEVGQIVSVPLRQGQALGIVTKVVDKPKFPTKTITTVETVPKMPEVSLKLIDWIKTYYPA